MFEEKYTKLITLDKYRENQNKDLKVSFIHNGYFISHRKNGKQFIKILMVIRKMMVMLII